MPIKYERKKYKQNTIFYTVITVLLLCTIFITVAGYFYNKADKEAYENLHVQTKQIKDDLTLQLKSDRENLATMANFASKLYKDGESYDLLFSSFEAIGLIDNIGILSPDNVFSTKAGSMDLTGLISFEEEKERGEYISGRIKDLTKKGIEIVRTAVPVVADGEVVGILYGVIKPEKLSKKYATMADELDAQLFLYDKETGNYIVDPNHEHPKNVAELKNREYREGFSYEELISTEKGYSSFKSAFTGEILYIHYSPIEVADWTIMLARAESKVFAETHLITRILFGSFAAIVLIVGAYLLILLGNEKRRRDIMAASSNIRKILLNFNKQQDSVMMALRNIMAFSKARSSMFVDADGEEYACILPDYEEKMLVGEERKYFISNLFSYAGELHSINKSSLSIMLIEPNVHMQKTNREFYRFLKEHKFGSVLIATVIDNNNHISIIGVVNPKRRRVTKALLADVSVCFSIAIYNKKHLNKTETAATTDSLTGAFNRVMFKRDIIALDEKKPEMFSCIYVDVNELHLHNNKHGHAAGDEMLIYIANTLKEVFYGHKIYRMGGDEFLVFTENVPPEEVKVCTKSLMEQLKPKNYHVAIGVSYRNQLTNTDEMLREAEIRMYEAKADYYQNKENSSTASDTERGYVQVNTGILEIDTLLSVMNEHYNGIYKVSLNNDVAHRILMPSYLGYNEIEENFTRLLMKYMDDMVSPDFHRALTNFFNYDSLRRQLLEGKTPRITYKKINGEAVVLTVYSLNDTKDNVDDTLWVFAKD